MTTDRYLIVNGVRVVLWRESGLLIGLASYGDDSGSNEEPLP